ncbi:MAG: hypothetical protein ACM359_24205 [Bacillota bacterium]
MKCSKCPRCTNSIHAEDAFCHACGYILRARRNKPLVYSSPVSVVDSPELLAQSPYQVTRWPMHLVGSTFSLLKLAGLVFLTLTCMPAVYSVSRFSIPL